MYLPPLQPVVNSDIFICGDVEIHPTASVASGVILQAAPESRIVIGADVCVGMGVIVNAYGGEINIESGATLGAGVLIIGQCQIGSNACIGTTTTIFNASVESMKVVTPGSIIGDNTRCVDNNSSANSSTKQKAKTKSSKTEASKTTPKPKSQTVSVTKPEKVNQLQDATETKSQTEELVNGAFSQNISDPWSEEKVENGLPEAIKTIKLEKIAENLETPENIAIGKVYIDQLLVTLFPHKKTSHNSSNSNNLE